VTAIPCVKTAVSFTTEISEETKMSGLFLLAQTESGGQIEQIAQRFGVDWSHLIAQTISFCIVAALLYRFAYHPVLTMLDERRKSIAEGLAAAEQNKAHLAETQAQREQVIAEANEQANRLIEEARNSAARMRDQKVQQAVAEAEQIVANARQATAREHDRMLSELKREVGKLVVETTAAVSGKVLSADDQHRLAEETANQLSV
jgi:F-type H+-transporting ATPase subunit b